MRVPVVVVTVAATAGALSLGLSPSSAAPADPSARAAAAAVSHAAQTGLSGTQDLAAANTVVDADGTTHVRFDRTHRGVPVLGGDLVVHQSKSGAWRGTSQTLRAPLALGVEPTVVKAAAARTALAPSKVTAKISGAEQQGTRLVIDAIAGKPRLAWEVLTGGVQDDGTPSRLATYVDAKTGKVLRTEQQIVNVDGTGRSLYGGTVGLQLTQSGSSYQLKDPTRGGNYTTDMGNATDSIFCQIFNSGCKTGTLFTSPDTSFGTGSASSRESAAVDAQYGTAVTWDYFKNVHGRNGIFGDGRGSFNRVHYGKKYVNAFWNGSYMTYGDGDGVDFGPLTSLDVAGHEMTHGVTEHTAGLVYSAESGGLNEATSDIFGTLVEFHAANANDPADYYVGEEFDLANGEGFRRMDNPASDGSSVNCWSAGVKDLDVHHSSGVGNHFFYLLAEGSGTKTLGGKTHTSTTCNGSTITGIGRSAAAKIWFRALDVYMTSNTNYKGARAATLSAARDLYGASSTQYNTVAASWSAVNVSS